MEDDKNVDYYLEKLDKKGLDVKRFNDQRFFPSSKNESFPNEKVFMNWLIEWDYAEFRSMGDLLFSVYSSPSSEQNIVINKFLKEENKGEEVLKLVDGCTEKSIYLLDILTSLKEYTADELVDIHNEIFENLEKTKEKVNAIISGALENFKKEKKENKKEHYIG
jgi:hypothetical protein